MDKISLVGIECRVRVGVPEWERKKPQKILIDVELSADLRAAGTSDDVRDTVDYWDVEKRVRAAAETGEFKLVERVAAVVARAAFAADRCIRSAVVRIHKKPAVMPRTRAVIIQIERKRGG